MVTVSNRGFIESVAGVITRMAPHNQPRSIDTIIDYCLTKIWEDERWDHGSDKFDFALLRLGSNDELLPLVKEYLMGCVEFVQLNISKQKWDGGVRTPDSDGIVFCGRGIPAIAWERDFIDLDACIRNIENTLFRLDDESIDCFLCKFSESYGSCAPSKCTKCECCIGNPHFKRRNNHETHPWALLPRNSEEYKQLVADGKITGMV